MEQEPSQSQEQEILVQDQPMDLITREELDIQITTAKRFPRSITAFQTEARSMVTATQEIAESCFYVLPRKTQDGK